MFNFGYEEIFEALTWNTASSSGMSPEDAQRAVHLLSLWMCNDIDELLKTTESDIYIAHEAAFRSSGWRPVSLYAEFSAISSFIDTHISKLKQID